MAHKFRSGGKYKLTVPENFDWPREPHVYLNLSGSEIIIEKGVTFSSGVYVITHSHHFNKSNWRDLPRIRYKKPTVFKKYCFIGINSIILATCKIIGEYSVIGSGSIVTKNIPPYEMWAGNPAKKIGEVEIVKDKK